MAYRTERWGGGAWGVGLKVGEIRLKWSGWDGMLKVGRDGTPSGHSCGVGRDGGGGVWTVIWKGGVKVWLCRSLRCGTLVALCDYCCTGIQKHSVKIPLTSYFNTTAQLVLSGYKWMALKTASPVDQKLSSAWNDI